MDIIEKLKFENTATSIEAINKIKSLRKRAKFWEKECRLERRKNFNLKIAIFRDKNET